MRFNKFIIFFVVFIYFFAVVIEIQPVSAQLSINSGQSCSSRGQISDFQTQRFICLKVNAKAESSNGPSLVWIKISSPKSTTKSTTTTVKISSTTVSKSCQEGGICIHGKRLGRIPLWTSGVNKQYQIIFNVYQTADALNGITISVTFPPASIYGCVINGPKVYRFSYYKSSTFGEILDAGRQELPIINNSDGLCSIRELSLHSLFFNDKWMDIKGNRTPTPPPPFYVKFKLENLSNGEVFESPFVLVDLSAID